MTLYRRPERRLPGFNRVKPTRVTLTDEEMGYLSRYYRNLSAETSPEQARATILGNALPEMLDIITNYLEEL